MADGTVLPTSQDCILRYLLERRTKDTPQKIFAAFPWDIPDWSYAGTLERVLEAARALKKSGAKQGDHVLSRQPNGPGALLAWLATNYLGAVYVPLNLAYRGGILAHAGGLSDAKVMIAHPDLLPRLQDIDTAHLRTVITDGAPDIALAGIDVLDAQALKDQSSDMVLTLNETIQPWDTCAIIYTSGTTGPSKAVLSPYLLICRCIRQRQPRFSR